MTVAIMIGKRTLKGNKCSRTHRKRLFTVENLKFNRKVQRLSLYVSNNIDPRIKQAECWRENFITIVRDFATFFLLFHKTENICYESGNWHSYAIIHVVFNHRSVQFNLAILCFNLSIIWRILKIYRKHILWKRQIFKATLFQSIVHDS